MACPVQKDTEIINRYDDSSANLHQNEAYADKHLSHVEIDLPDKNMKLIRRVADMRGSHSHF